ncbi:54S ribosomal protein yml6, mitochondrial [Coniothyrium glycines]
MASTRISAPMRGVTSHLGRLSIRQDAVSARSSKSLLTLYPRSISTSTSPRASVSAITPSAANYAPVKPFEEQIVTATIHQFPSLEPLRFETFPANHLYLPTRKDILHRAVIYEGDMTRLGTASTKTRHEVRGSSKKVRPQKGTGHARIGDRKSPMLRGGGVAFGPKPRDFSTELPKKVYDLAWRTALSYRFRKGELIIVDNAMEIESPSARLLSDIFKYHEKMRGKGRSLLVTTEERPLLEQALADMDRADQAVTWDFVDVKNLLELSRVIIERDALHNILLSHQEDLTNKALQPWHKSLVQSSPPKDLEATIGWQEFRSLALTDPEDREAVRAQAYESAAETRYAYAESLPQGLERSELTISAYKLLAEAKEIQFKEKTGAEFSKYTRSLEQTDWTEVVFAWPRIQALDYEIQLKRDQVDRFVEESAQLNAEKANVQARRLEVEKLELQYDAALLAAQVHEHVAEAESLAGQEAASQSSLGLASAERTNMDMVEDDLLGARIALADNEAKVAGLKNDYAGQKKALADKQQWVSALEAKRAEHESMSAESEVDEIEVHADVESPKEQTASR